MVLKVHVFSACVNRKWQLSPSPLLTSFFPFYRMSRRQDWTDSKKWRELDMNVQCVFGLYMARLDPFDRLGLSAEASIER